MRRKFAFIFAFKLTFIFIGNSVDKNRAVMVSKGDSV